MLRQEVYALDGTAPSRTTRTSSPRPSYAVRAAAAAWQANRHAVFLTHPREALTYHYERDPADPRVGPRASPSTGSTTFGNVLRAAAVGYGRRQPDPTLDRPRDQRRGRRRRASPAHRQPRHQRASTRPTTTATPLPCESRTYELTGVRAARPDVDALQPATSHAVARRRATIWPTRSAERAAARCNSG